MYTSFNQLIADGKGLRAARLAPYDHPRYCIMTQAKESGPDLGNPNVKCHLLYHICCHSSIYKDIDTCVTFLSLDSGSDVII